MEEKENQHIPKPGLPEALHPEIGNGALWEEQAHMYLLRSPDPTKGIERFLQVAEPAEQNEGPSIATQPEPKSVDIVKVKSDEGDLHEPDTIRTSENDSRPIVGKDEDALPPEDLSLEDQKPVVKRKKKSKGSPRTSDTASGPVEEDPPVSGKTKAPKAGKLVRKAAKSVRKREISQLEVEKPIREVVLETTLSPFTQWLKSLKGSDYVHPYDDDFALYQGVGPLNEGISETFADLLVAQGYRDQAVEMYKKLMEKYPEKSGFFAAKIQALQ